MKNNIVVRLLAMVFSILIVGGIAFADNARAEPIAADNPMDQRAKKAEAFLIAAYDAEGPGAAYVISKDGKILASGGVGIADMEWGTKITDETVLRLGSISKSITAIAVLQLVEKGLIDLDQPISQYDQNLPEQMGAVTTRQLLSHRSGLAEHVWNPDLMPLIWQPVTTQQMIDLQKDKPVDFKPGEKYKYVNFNYVLVAHIIEQVTGQRFVDFINAFFASHAMPSSHYDWHDSIIAGRAEFYDRHDDVIANSQEVDLSHVSAAGALLSSARDLAHWAHLLLGNRLVEPATLNEAWTPVPLPDGTSTKYGLGFNVSKLSGERQIWHNGLTPGSQAAFGIIPDQGLFIAILSNGFYLPNSTKLMDNMTKIMLTGELAAASPNSGSAP